MKALIALSAIISAALMLLAPAALADPARHMHDYFATLGRESATAAGFSWTDALVGAGIAIGGLVVLGTATTLAIRRRRQVPTLSPLS